MTNLSKYKKVQNIQKLSTLNNTSQKNSHYNLSFSSIGNLIRNYKIQKSTTWSETFQWTTTYRETTGSIKAGSRWRSKDNIEYTGTQEKYLL